MIDPAGNSKSLESRFPIVLLADNVRSLANVGALFRVADAVRVEKLVLCGITGYPRMVVGVPRPSWVVERATRQIVKTAIQTVDLVRWEHVEQAVDVVQGLRSLGYQIVVLEQSDRSCRYDEAPYRFPLCLVVGHEREGVSSAVRASGDLVVEIPMYGSGHSLNVATSAAVCLYELARTHLRRSTTSNH